ncbi:MAG: RluA family pseudouridine synthase [Myxococcaceae bacterium]
MRLNRGYCYREQLGEPARGKTALEYLSTQYRHSTEEEWRARFVRGEVFLEGAVVAAKAPLRPGALLVWNRPPWEEPDVTRSYALIHEDEALLAVVKPSGLPTIPGGGFLENTLLNVVRERFFEASPVHRLGRGTSGLVLFARTAPIAAQLSKAWRDREVLKRYRALSVGSAREDVYEISAPIGVVPHPRLGTVFAANAEGKSSSSTARVLFRRENETVFQVDIHTGRPDQIRIHLAFIGHPLVGDELYAAGGLPRAHLPALPGDVGYLLHAQQLRFKHPLTGAPLHLFAPAPW